MSQNQAETVVAEYGCAIPYTGSAEIDISVADGKPDTIYVLSLLKAVVHLRGEAFTRKDE